ncbi:MAG: FAD-dependent oxidoreductase, partial [Pseudomonadota bacterium]
MQIVFAGAGHANLVALDLLTKRPFDGHLTLVSSGAHAYYSGMVPGSIEGVYQEGAGTIPLAAFCARRGIGFLDGKILGLNGNQLVTEKGDVPFDLLIINTGAVARALAVKGQEHVLAAKPVEALFSGLASRLSAPGYVIAGAGAAGLEVAFALRAR